MKDMGDNNRIIGAEPEISNAKINFSGENNILYCEQNVKIENCTIKFQGNNSLIFLKEGTCCFNAKVVNDSFIYVGKHNYFNPNTSPILIIASEHKNIFIGDNNLFSYGVYMRTADPHLIYDIESKERINYSKSIYIGDHVWLGQNAAILKGSKIHSSCVVGAEGVVAGKELCSNAVWAGNPVKMLRNNIFWNSACTHTWTEEQTEENSKNLNQTLLYSYNDKEYLPFDTIEKELDDIKSCEDKLEYLKNITQDKNRFTYFE